MTTSNSHSVEPEIVNWTAPKVHRPARYVAYAPIADELRRHPGEWAKLADRSSPSAAYQFALGVRRGVPVAFRPAGQYEGAYDGTSVWVRYLGHVEGIQDMTPSTTPCREQTPDVDENLNEEGTDLASEPDSRGLFTF